MQQSGYDPPLNWVDAWLLAVLTNYRWRWSRPLKLWRLIDLSDVLFRGEASFDDVSFALPRLLAAGLIDVDRDKSGELQFKGTRAAFALKARAKGKDGPMRRFAQAVGAQPYPDGDDGNRSLGRYPDLTARDWAKVRQRLDHT